MVGRRIILSLAPAALWLLTGCSPAAEPAGPAPAAAEPTSAVSGGKMDAHSEVPHDLSPDVADAELAGLVRDNTDFAFALYREISGGWENLFYSPHSLSIAFAMTYAGARGRTAEQLARALHYALPQERLHPAFNRLALELAGRSDAEGGWQDEAFQLETANALWGQAGFGFREDFLDLLARNYGAGMRLADFAADPEAARARINAWVLQETQDKIRDLIPPGVINRLTRLVLTNAVYFKAAWQDPFDPDATRNGTFHLLNEGTTTVPLMSRQTGLRSGREEGYRAVELPYAGGRLTMLILLPDAGGFRDVEARLDRALIDEAVASLRPGEVYLILPRFQFEWTADDLAGTLNALGMVDAFAGDADFSGMDGALDLFIQAVLHKAFVGVDEFGTEAAASTAVIMQRKGMPMQPLEIRIDRPFLFLIRDNLTGTILFLGRVLDPSA